MVIYLIHPWFINFWYSALGWLGFAFDQVPVLLFYVLVLLSSLAAGMVIQALAARFRTFGILVLGRQPG